MSKFLTRIIERNDLSKPVNFSIVSPDGYKVLFIGTLSRCWDKRDFFEKKYKKSCPTQLELNFEL